MSTPDMPPPEDRLDELHALTEASLGGDLSDEQIARLEQLVCESPEFRKLYVRYMFVSWNLRTWAKYPLPDQDQTGDAEEPDADDSQAFPVISVTSPKHASPLPLRAQFGQEIFSYAVSAFVLCLAFIGAWMYQVEYVGQSAENDAPTLERPVPVFAGMVTNMRDCAWADPETSTVVGASIPLGRKYDLSSGLLEITYNSGAKVLIEGPCEFVVDSKTGGRLQLGKLVVRVGKKVASGQWPVASAKPQAANPQSLIPNPPLSAPRSPLFAISTPSAIVTDLGTEFGVEVDRSGNCTAYVFEGKVSVKPGGTKKSGRPTELNAGESARVERSKDEVVVRPSGTAESKRFVRGIPHRGPIRVFDTGYHIHCGNPEPRWRITAGLNVPDFKPQQAVTTAVMSKSFRSNIAGKLLWISTGRNLPLLPEETTYTFQTSFHLNGEPPEGLELHVAFAADNHVDAIRINGKPVDVPEHGYLPPFHDMHELTITDGFVGGGNTLEFDVYNGAPSIPKRPSMMALLVELEAVVNTEHDKPEIGGKEGD